MRFFLDQGIPLSTVDELAELDQESVHVSQIGMSRASDQQILEEAQKRSATVVTFDSDFHSLLALGRLETISVIRIRIEGLKGIQVARIVQEVLATCESDLKHGAAITVTENRIRVRRLPLP